MASFWVLGCARFLLYNLYYVNLLLMYLIINQIQDKAIDRNKPGLLKPCKKSIFVSD